MANNYVLLDRIELNNTAASVTFSNLPQSGYTDLKVVVSARSNRSDTNDFLKISFNSLTTNLSHRSLSGDGSSASSGSDGSFIYGRMNGNTSTANTFGNAEFYIPNYASSSAKSVSGDTVMENNATYSVAYMLAGLWNSTAAITSIDLAPYYGSFVANSTFSLYGLAAVGVTPTVAPKADGGNVIATDGTYWYHAFLANGTFTPQVALSADVLVVAGGGGGTGGTSGVSWGAGGGAAQVAFTSSSLTTSVAVTVGAGGAGTNINAATGSQGASSSFGSVLSSIGGFGGVAPYTGGAAGITFVGGSGSGASSGGGAGSTANGGNSSGGTGGAGGAGNNTYSSWLSATSLGVSGFISGGGGGGGSTTGGAAGSGGGGRGTDNGTSNNTSGVANTGSGGGGGGVGQSAIGNGGSGIVIIRYLVA